MRACLCWRPAVAFALVLAALAVAVSGGPTRGQEARQGNDSPMLGGSPSRNPVNLAARGLPGSWEVEKGKRVNVRWVADIGTRGYGAPVIAGGKVYVSTNNEKPRDPKVVGPRAVIMCFEEATGKFLWQVTHDMPPPEVDDQAMKDGMCSTPTAEGGKLYYVTPGCVVVCADADTGKEAWSYDMMKKLKVFPCIINACAPLVVGDAVYVVTGNGVDDQGGNKGGVKEPKAPSFAAFDKKTGGLKWQSNLPGKNIIHGQWGSPAYAEVGGKGQVVFPGGDGYLYGLDPKTGEMVWKFQCSPYEPGMGDKRNYPVATPTVHGGKAFYGIGNAPDTGYGDRVGHFWCIDLSRKGDVSPPKFNFDPKAPENKDSALVWHHGGKIEPRPKFGRPVFFGPTLSSACVHDGLVYVCEEAGYLHCLDEKTGKKVWEHDFKTGVWGSAYYADGRVFVGTEDGDVVVFAAGPKKKVLETIFMDEKIQSTPVAANGVLYVTTVSKVYAIGKK